MIMLPLLSVTTMLPSPKDDGTFREDGHGGPVVRHPHCAAFTIRQHHILPPASPNQEDVAIKAKHGARTVCGFDDGIALLIDSEDISLPIGSTTLPSASPTAMMLLPESSTTPEPSSS